MSQGNIYSIKMLRVNFDPDHPICTFTKAYDKHNNLDILSTCQMLD